MDRGRSRLRAVVLVWGALLVPAVCPAVASASANLNWGSGVKSGLPGDAGSNPDATVGSVSCASAGNCTAVGGYRDATNHNLGLLVTDSAGSWANGMAEVQPPGNASTTGAAIGVKAVSCALAGDCTAVGNYKDTSDYGQGLLLTQSGGSWSNGAQEAPLPGGPGATNPGVTLYSVSCPSAGNCGAVGYYDDANGYQQGLLLSESSGSWAPVEVIAPADHDTDPYGSLYAISCPSPGNCSAVGAYQDTSSHTQGLLERETAGTWSSPGEPPHLPANANLTMGGAVFSVSCASAGECTALGEYFDSSSRLQGLLLNESSGSWSTGAEVPLPANRSATVPGVQPNSVSCSSPGNCSAVGSYDDTSGYQQGLLLSESHGSWSALDARLPANANANPDVVIRRVSCTSPGNCAAVGSYRDGADSLEGLLFTRFHGSWSRGVEAHLPGDANPTNPLVRLFSVSCPAPGSCSATGDYADTSGYQQGLLLSATPVRPSLTMRTPTRGVVGSHIAASTVTATIAGGQAPIGKITFKVIGPRSTAPTSCVSGGTAVGTATVAGNKSYHPSADFTPHSAGDYWWYATYGGDASDRAAASRCGTGMARTVVGPS